jgi:hypothetical protein
LLGKEDIMDTENVNKYLKNKLDELKKKLSELQDES